MRRLREVPADARAAAQANGALLTAMGLAAAGVSKGQRQRLVGREVLVPLAKGVYAPVQACRNLDLWEAFRLRTRAFLLASPPGAVAADWSAIAMHRLPAIGGPPPLPSVIRPGHRPSGSDVTSQGRTRYSRVADEWLDEVDGVAVVGPAFAAMDAARRSRRTTSLTIIDAVAGRLGGTDGLQSAAQAMSSWPGIARARWALAHADPDAESPLESVGRCALVCAGLPVPLSNVWLGIDFPRFRVDHYWEEQRLALEGDGIEKYLLGGAGAAAVDPRAALRREKERELCMRGWGVTTDRYTWARAFREPGLFAGRCAEMLRLPPLPAHPGLRWWPASEGFRILGIPRPRR